ncbi:MAG TPA: MBL fold metallo-hydrolase [Thermoanaerobaculia bacterium]|jgi:glyoxylase-like metal-dependent hydrolase (beta-lactamase superfamily II)
MKTLLLGCLFLAAAAASFGQPAGDVTTSYETVKVADGIWAFIAPETKSALVSGNCVAIIGDDGVVVVDTGMIPSLTRRMIAEIRQKTDKPVRYVVNTHWHWDHNFGNFVYRDEFPNVTIISTAFTRASMVEFNAKMLDTYRQRGTAYGERLHKMLEERKNRDGSAMTPEQVEENEALSHDLDHAMPEIQKGRVELPNQTFTDSLTLFLGKREVDIRFLGRGNTAGDAVVSVPDAKAVMTGDLLVGPIPFGTGSYVSEWIAVMKKVDAMDAAVIVPGHGPVEHDRGHLHAFTALLESIDSQVRAAVQAGLSLDETRKRVDISKFADQLTAGIASRKRNFEQYFATPMVELAYKQAKGEPTVETAF